MESRNITIVSTKEQGKKVINTNAETLGELKAALDAAGINYEDMTFYEGLTHTELLMDSSILPKDVVYKGTVTNELVFMLTNANKKIKSGISDVRTGLYDRITKYHLENECVEVYGKNFTQCKDSELMALIEGYETSYSLPTNELVVKLANVLLKKGILTIEDFNIEAPTIKSSYSDDDIEEMFKGIE